MESKLLFFNKLIFFIAIIFVLVTSFSFHVFAADSTPVLYDDSSFVVSYGTDLYDPYPILNTVPLDADFFNDKCIYWLNPLNGNVCYDPSYMFLSMDVFYEVVASNGVKGLTGKYYTPGSSVSYTNVYISHSNASGVNSISYDTTTVTITSCTKHYSSLYFSRLNAFQNTDIMRQNNILIEQNNSIIDKLKDISLYDYNIYTNFSVTFSELKNDLLNIKGLLRDGFLSLDSTLNLGFNNINSKLALIYNRMLYPDTASAYFYDPSFTSDCITLGSDKRAAGMVDFYFDNPYYTTGINLSDLTLTFGNNVFTSYWSIIDASDNSIIDSSSNIVKNGHAYRMYSTNVVNVGTKLYVTYPDGSYVTFYCWNSQSYVMQSAKSLLIDIANSLRNLSITGSGSTGPLSFDVDLSDIEDLLVDLNNSFSSFHSIDKNVDKILDYMRLDFWTPDLPDFSIDPNFNFDFDVNFNSSDNNKFNYLYSTVVSMLSGLSSGELFMNAISFDNDIMNGISFVNSSATNLFNASGKVGQVLLLPIVLGIVDVLFRRSV